MPTTPNGVPYPAATDLVKNGAAAIQAVAVALDPLLPPITAGPPAAPVDRQLWAMAPVAGVVWMFRYNAASASAYKWEFVGGPELQATPPVTAAASTPSLYPAFVDLAGGPSIVAPRAGDYVVAVSMHAENNATGGAPLIGVHAGAAAVLDTDVQFATPATPNYSVALSHRVRLNAVAAGDAIRAGYCSLSGGTSTFWRRQLFVHPVRVA